MQYIESSSAYAAVLHEIKVDIMQLQAAHPALFTFTTLVDGAVNIRDSLTTGGVAFAKGIPRSQLRAGKQNIGGHCVEVNEPYRQDCLAAINGMVALL
jgi:hypothetical protein